MLKSGKFRGEKVQYPDGIGCCVWVPLSEKDEDVGLAYDFSYADIDDLIKLLETMKKVAPEIYEPDEIDKEISEMSQEEVVQAIQDSAGMWTDREGGVSENSQASQ